MDDGQDAGNAAEFGTEMMNTEWKFSKAKEASPKPNEVEKQKEPVDETVKTVQKDTGLLLLFC